MRKIPISRRELADKVLAAIREHPQCRSVKEIAITPADIANVGPTWHVNIIEAGEADVAVAYTVAREVREKLTPLFRVVD